MRRKWQDDSGAPARRMPHDLPRGAVDGTVALVHLIRNVLNLSHHVAVLHLCVVRLEDGAAMLPKQGTTFPHPRFFHQKMRRLVFVGQAFQPDASSVRLESLTYDRVVQTL